MKHKNLSVRQRYSFLFVLLFCIICVATMLFRTWNQTPETHFAYAVEYMNKNQSQEAINHFILAQKSQDESVRQMSYLYLARMYHHGANKVPVNMDKAAFYYEQAANLNSIEALYTLALLYDVGDKIPENREKAKDYMTKAAEVLPDAQYALGVWIERGYFGTPDIKKAVALYEKAAHAGFQSAIKSLIALYHGGFGGFPKNIEKEHYWRAKLK